MNYGEYETNFGRKIAIRNLEERIARQYFGGRQGSRRRRESRSNRFGDSTFDWNNDWRRMPEYFNNVSRWDTLSDGEKKNKWVNELSDRDTIRELNILPRDDGEYVYDPNQPGYAQGVWEPTWNYFHEKYMRKAGLLSYPAAATTVQRYFRRNRSVF